MTTFEVRILGPAPNSQALAKLGPLLKVGPMAEDPTYRSFFFKTQKKNFEGCLHPSFTCKRPPIRAHSIQNRRVLDLIQQDGQVRMPRYKIKGDKRALEFESVGRNQASTFTGLCSQHDNALFKVIDSEPLNVDNDEHLRLVAFFEKMSAQWREEQNRCPREIERHQSADQSYMDEGMQLLELARNAQKLFERQEPREKRRLLNFVLSNCTWEDGELVANFRRPFDLLAETTAIARQSATNETAKSAKTEIWLGM